MIATCIVCGKPFEPIGHWARLCSSECRKARRRARDADSAEAGLPPPTRPCDVCGKPALSPRKTCSPECQRERKRRRWRAGYHSLTPQKKQAALERHRQRRLNDPDWARANDARKWAQTKADPEKLAKSRKKARAWYASNAERIQTERRKARQEALSRMDESELAEYIERHRRYVRDHRRRVDADPERRGRYAEAQREWRRRKREALLSIGAEAAREELRKRLDGEVEGRKASPCLICGKPILGRKPNARSCSRVCQRKRILQRLYPPRPRPCLECGKVFEDKTCSRVCSQACAKNRKARKKRGKNHGEA